ncbi:MAG: PAS domain S-box protein [Solirubrobacteraceae bacterium]|nr:PAS domain S-box protein [Solirubrobacteraceae bacterium]
MSEADRHGTILRAGYRLSLVLDPDGRVLAVPEIERITGATEETFLGRSITEISAERGGPHRDREWRRRLALARDATETVHYADPPPGAPADSQELTVDCTLTPIRAAGGTLQAILVVVEDRTAFLDTQHALRESEQRFRTLAESLPQMVWTADATGEVDYFSPRWEQFTGRTSDDLLGRGYRDLIHPDDIEGLAQARQAARWEHPVGFRLRRHDGAYRAMEAHLQPVLAADGSLVRIVGGTIDITERRMSEERERELQEQLRSALAMTGLGRFTLDLRAGVLEGDQRLEEILGQPATERLTDANPDRLFEPIHPEDRPRLKRAFEAAISGEGTFAQEYRVMRPTTGEPEERWVAVAGRVEFDVDGPARLFGVIEDTTDRRREAELRLRTQKREAIGTLAGGIAHDFNNVIGAILSNAALAQRELDLGTSPRTSLAEIERGAGRAADIVRRMLMFSREDTPERRRVDLTEVTTEACALVRPTLPESVALQHAPGSPDPALVLGDATQLHQVVMNLVRNAGQALGQGGGTVSLTVEAALVDRPSLTDDRAPSGACVRLEVRDDGPGMPEEVRRRAFDPFFTTKAAGEGTGLGLAAAQTIVRNHGGTIEIDSMVGEYTAVTVLLPAAEAGQPGHAGDDRARLPETPATATPKAPPRVMFVDDEPALAQLAERALPAFGCGVAVFTDPEDALQAFTNAPDEYDALITDLSMPGLSGLELSAQLRDCAPALPIVLTSGFLTPANERQAKRQGIDAVVAKPCAIDELAALVLRLVAAGAAARAPSAREV